MQPAPEGANALPSAGGAQTRGTVLLLKTNHQNGRGTKRRHFAKASPAQYSPAPCSSGEDTQGETWHLVSPSKPRYPLPNPELLREARPACGLQYHQHCRQTPSTAPGWEPTWETTMGAATSLGTNRLAAQSHQHIPSTGIPLGLHGAGSTMHPPQPRSVTKALQRSAAPLSPLW